MYRESQSSIFSAKGEREEGASEICSLTAVEMASRIRSRELSAVEVMEAHLEQIERLNPQVNAIVTLVPEQAMSEAREADEALARGEDVGPLHGLPVAHKDLFATRGIRTTYGSPIFKDFVPEEDALIVKRLREAGAITIGKTNTPEFGAGSQTFNEVFCETRNPYDLSKTCGGSSGGAAAALACGMIPIADGSDMGGSLRNPAAFCNVVGLRPSPGRVPTWPSDAPWSPLSVDGPMGRTVGDVALVLYAISGPDTRAPLSISEVAPNFGTLLDRDFDGTRVAWSQNLGGLPFDERVTERFEAQSSIFEELGCVLKVAEPDLSSADEVFKVWRAWQFELSYGKLLDTHRADLKDTVVREIEEGRKLTGQQIGRAERLRAALYQKMREFMQEYDFLILPTTQVPPFDIEQRYVTEINGVKLETYIDWMRSCYYITITGLPAISVPCGFTPEGLPIGLQIVGRYRDELGVLRLASAFERASREPVMNLT